MASLPRIFPLSLLLVGSPLLAPTLLAQQASVDYATNIAEDIVYMEEGDIVRHGEG